MLISGSAFECLLPTIKYCRKALRLRCGSFIAVVSDIYLLRKLKSELQDVANGIAIFCKYMKKVYIVNIVHRVNLYSTLFVGFIYFFARSKSRITAISKMEFFNNSERLKVIKQCHRELHFRCCGHPRYQSVLISKLTKVTERYSGKKVLKMH